MIPRIPVDDSVNELGEATDVVKFLLTCTTYIIIGGFELPCHMCRTDVLDISQAQSIVSALVLL